MSRSDDWQEIDCEYPPPGEAEDIAETVRLSEEILRLNKGPVRRGQHAKATGVVRARLVVDPNRPSETRFGIFEQTRTYEAIVRFSNGSGIHKPDTEKDGRGMAIKVLDVEGTRLVDDESELASQDFVMLNISVFPIRNVRQYRKLTARKLFFMSKLGTKGSEIATLLFFIPLRFSQFWNIGRKIRRKSQSPLVEQYWSSAPFRLGKRAIRFTLVPQPINFESLTTAPTGTQLPDDFLSQVVVDHLRQREARFDFQVQFQKDPVATPIEDPTVEWKQSDSPLIKVATLVIDPVDLTAAEVIEFKQSVEAMAFNPWNSIEDHQPLGGINRLRKAVYHSNSRMRRESADR